MKKVLFFTFALCVTFFIGCRTIEITEADAFDSHRTITPENFDISGFNFEETTISTSDGETLNSWHLTKDNATTTVIYFGGNSSLMVTSRPVIRAYSDLPVNLILFDYRGFGRSSGSPTIEGVKTDARSIFQYIQESGLTENGKVILHGHSLGSHLAATLANEQEIIDAYILESPISDTKNWTRSLVPWIARPFIRFDVDDNVASQNNKELIESIDIPLLIISGTADDVTPTKMANELYEHSSSEHKNLLQIRGGSHNNLPSFNEYRSTLNNFINNLP